MKKVVFIGLGYIGLPTAAVAAHHGFEVVGVDVNPSVVETVNQGKVHIVEPDLGKIVKEAVQSGHLRAVTRPEPADAFFVVVPTPFKQNHRADITYVESATRSVIPCLKPGDLFVIESTSPVFTTERMAELIFQQRPELKDQIYIAYCPERVLPGNTLYELVHNDRVIGGINPASTDKAIEFYSAFVQGKLHRTNARTAEMCKLTENSSRDSQIAFANELSMICDKAGINVWELIELANKHPRVNILQPGCGVGGHCIAVDPWFIVSDYPEQAQLIKRARETNDYKADWCANKVLESCQRFVEKYEREPIVACMGLAFKPNIDDLRESPAKYIASRIVSESRADVLIVEPNITSHPSFHITDYKEAYQKADIIVWLVRHTPFVELPRKEEKLELDFCGVRK
ncbi:UDP-N-acetyl-D-mannosamine dehydrogenase [Bacteroides helcogenes]|uniref:Nucleotide sugar dehydrogenase n=1 Tax=Bacteroides helcogenes (strain ATCC 35417 / DSM 20613 / JCM 6297 / CCUG 15421 / P 36-108) TaxID=693979 RepID=E6SPI5_BACT6|nr:UDP-N-acetyl-D-mannosamine dehydrogenase [Bacteroides helcogenes]ADV42874.1 nucleotide sugar dehydrogenase [Bacteroides helcogenes P 36-108]MDY5238221.1 UDP-N-acetyl-D-mannosamine dehydrogenase [Bacteroides helcogenes]